MTNNIWQFITNALNHEQTVMLLIVVDSQGSTPAKIGAKLAVTQTQTYGTIGGGAIEHALIKQARQQLTQANFHYQITHHHHQPKHENASGMICGGSQTVLMYACQQKELPLYQQLCTSKLLTLNITSSGIHLNSTFTKASLEMQNQTWLYQETLNQKKHAYIIGGGHVSLALSRILTTLDYHITVIEQRDNIETFINNHYADGKLNSSYQQLNTLILENSYVFIMTHSHKTDALALSQLHDKPLAYLGLLGSKQKIAELTKGYKHCTLHAPIGLNIHSHTPEEIAVSIAAELIQLNNTV